MGLDWLMPNPIADMYGHHFLLFDAVEALVPAEEVDAEAVGVG